MNPKALLLNALGILIGSSASAALVTIDFATVGNAGNANDTTGFGAVAAQFGIGKYEVTNAQYTEFLNAKASSDPLGLYNTGMTIDSRGGIIRLGVADSFTYSAKAGFEQRPVVFVGFYDAVRFANWLNNGQGSASTETGAYTLFGGTAVPSNGATFTRNAGASVFLPSQNEWYKAAYHQPGADANDYWLYPTRSNAVPLATAPNSTNANSANFTSPNSFESPGLTPVGGFTLAASFYGTFDQGGNAIEWNESIVAVGQRGLRGGTWLDFETFMRATNSDMDSSIQEDEFIGFRVAAVPEPTVFGSLILGLLVVAARHRKIA